MGRAWNWKLETMNDNIFGKNKKLLFLIGGGITMAVIIFGSISILYRYGGSRAQEIIVSRHLEEEAKVPPSDLVEVVKDDGSRIICSRFRTLDVERAKTYEFQSKLERQNQTYIFSENVGPGLKVANEVNMCYALSVLHCLANIPIFLDALKSDHSCQAGWCHNCRLREFMEKYHQGKLRRKNNIHELIQIDASILHRDNWGHFKMVLGQIDPVHFLNPLLDALKLELYNSKYIANRPSLHPIKPKPAYPVFCICWNSTIVNPFSCLSKNGNGPNKFMKVLCVPGQLIKLTRYQDYSY